MEFIIIAILLLGIILYLNYKKKLRLKKEEKERIRIAEEKNVLKNSIGYTIDNVRN